MWRLETLEKAILNQKLGQPGTARQRSSPTRGTIITALGIVLRHQDAGMLCEQAKKLPSPCIETADDLHRGYVRVRRGPLAIKPAPLFRPGVPRRHRTADAGDYRPCGKRERTYQVTAKEYLSAAGGSQPESLVGP